MNLKIEVNIDDEWFEDDETLSEAIQNVVKQKVLNAIWQKVEKSVDDKITRDVRDTMEKTLDVKMKNKIQEILDSGVLPGPYSNSDPMTIDQWVESNFKSGRHNSPEDIVKQSAKRLTDELRERYDMMFASQIVTKLNDQGMLKDDIAKMLLTERKEQ